MGDNLDNATSEKWDATSFPPHPQSSDDPGHELHWTGPGQRLSVEQIEW